MPPPATPDRPHPLLSPPRLVPEPDPDAEPPGSTADLVVRAGAAVLAARRARTTAHGIPLTAVRLLDVLARTGGLLQRELAARAGISPTTLTPALDRLEEDGLALRRVDAADRRGRRVTITESGRERLAAARAAAHGPRLPDPPGEHGEIVRGYLLAVIAHLEQDRSHVLP